MFNYRRHHFATEIKRLYISKAQEQIGSRAFACL